jgi:hypothetical protein
VGEGRDERLDWERSTQAACSYLTELVGELQGLSFTLAIAAYPKGPLAARGLLTSQTSLRPQEVTLWQFYRDGRLKDSMETFVIQVLTVAAVSETPEKYFLPPRSEEDGKL